LVEALDARPGSPQAVWLRRESDDTFALALVNAGDAVGPGWMHAGDAPRLVWRSSDAPDLDGALLRYRDGGYRVALRARDDESFAASVRLALEEGVNPLVASHGGRVLLVEAREGVARIRMEGGCQGCTSARETLQGVVERHLLHAVPGLVEVDDVTDHGAGTAPWYAPARDGVIALPVLPHGLAEACR
jgi:Fe-S cluster biogenesis protein NfuA